MLRAVAANTEVGGFHGFPGLGPNFLAGPAPPLSDRVTQKDQLGFSYFGNPVEGFMTLGQAGFRARFRNQGFWHCRLLGVGGGDRPKAEDGENKSFHEGTVLAEGGHSGKAILTSFPIPLSRPV